MTRLQDETKQRIETLAEDVLREVYGDLANIDLPIDPSRVAEKYGLNVFSSTFTDPAISGIYDKNKRDLHVAGDEYLPRQLFTMGHELGHFFLHEDKEEEVFYRRDALVLEGKPVEETEADWFASTLLMPAALIRAFWDITKNVERLAENFGVSESAMRWRLHNLGIMNNATPKTD